MGWQIRNSVNIQYLSHSEEKTDRMIDPYILTYYNNAWYVKAFCHLKKDLRIFAIHRICKADATELTFKTDEKVI